MRSDQQCGAVVSLLSRRINRRDLLVGGGVIAVGGTVGCTGSDPVAPVAETAGDFLAIAGGREDRILLPEGFSAEVVLRWGDPLIAGADPVPIADIPSGSLFGDAAGNAQATAFGASCDGMAVFEFGPDRLLVCVNHETPEISRMFPGWSEALRERRSIEFMAEHPEAVAVMRASVGVSVIELERRSGTWTLVADSPRNRRITADTPIEFAGPAAGHSWLGGSESEAGSCLGTFGNCAAGPTPWGTYLTAEENTNDFFGNGAEAEFEPLLARANERFGMRMGTSAYRWEAVDPRFDHVSNPAESMKFGWIVEIDPRDPDKPIRKRTALGRMRHEGATTVIGPDGRPVVYMGDDSSFEYFYKFVSDEVYDPDDPASTETLLDRGTLYVARLNDDGSGDWLPLVYGAQSVLSEANGFSSQADVVLRAREAADLLGATPLDRPEDVAVHPDSGRVYLACTQGLNRGFMPDNEDAAAAESASETAEDQEPALPGADGPNPRAPNPYGHILEFSEAGADATGERFGWEVFILAGDPTEQGLAAVAIAGRLAPAVAYYAGLSDSAGLSAFACPDNLGFDRAGNLWIVTDGAQPNANNNGCFVCPTEGPDRGRVRQFMSGPVGAEISGCTFSPDGETLFLTVQHPGFGSSIAEPSSHWPDGGNSQPRSSLIAVRSIDTRYNFPSIDA